jgi:hypothetical protein
MEEKKRNCNHIPTIHCNTYYINARNANNEKTQLYLQANKTHITSLQGTPGGKIIANKPTKHILHQYKKEMPSHTYN